MEDSKALIYTTIAEVISKIGAISKDRQNQQQHFQYRGVDDVMNELHSVFAECGLFIVPTVLSEERTEGKSKSGSVMFYTRQKIQFTFYAKDGSHIESTVIGEAMDSGDKASNKALSIAFKYVCLQVFCIPTEEDKDPDANAESLAPKTAPKAEPAKVAQQALKQPANHPVMAGGESTPEEKAAMINLLAALYPNGSPVFTQGDKKYYSAMRQQKTAQEVIALIQQDLMIRTTKAQEQIPADIM